MESHFHSSPKDWQLHLQTDIFCGYGVIEVSTIMRNGWDEGLNTIDIKETKEVDERNDAGTQYRWSRRKWRREEKMNYISCRTIGTEVNTWQIKRGC